MKKIIFTLLFALALSPCTGCSDSDNDNSAPVITAEPATDMVIYEANPRVFATERAFTAIESDLERIKSFGTTVLWLMPVNEPGEVKSVGSPYCIKDYLKLNTRYGTERELKSLVSAAHDKGMKVILDWVANHTSWDNAWINLHPDWYTKDASGNIISPAGQNWKDVADLNYDNHEMRRAMIDAMKYWLTTVGIDGFRCDYAEGVPDDFWKEATTELRQVNPSVLMMAEGGNAALTDEGFNMVYGWDFHSKLKDLYSGKATVSDLFSTNAAERRNMAAGSLRLRYSTNHDQASEVSPVACYGGKRGAMSAFVIATMLEGVPLIYSSQEAAYADKLNFFEYKPIDLNADKKFAAEMTAVIAAYKKTSFVRSGRLKTYATGKAVVFSRNNGQQTMLVAVNPTAQNVDIKTPIEQARLSMTDLIKGRNITVPAQMVLGPYEYIILSK